MKQQCSECHRFYHVLINGGICLFCKEEKRSAGSTSCNSLVYALREINETLLLINGSLNKKP